MATVQITMQSPQSYIPLYCIISQNGLVFSVHYYGSSVKASKQGYSFDTFDGVPPETPVVDYRTATADKIYDLVIRRCSGTIEERAQTDTVSQWLTVPAYTPVPLETYLQYAREAGATVSQLKDVIL